ncbi:uncharacterized protein PHALS_10537 [Plasmopara halstedii]|uniref:F-box domain-containing protein n=1 Tax=Plasmopara halstedii TaxID=4781 RepID=A0A0P1AGX5_PLAHL|nr:uncharacterized protein PHALS_10537 [Plasmopara halstedii]CEG40332.1 hypothetical protein PHALS_10537 [Plasmopara halstedii]|eukprot:XP_024576701.1 hypothetical protein PHALS_10537 [Plasmopara halstedii]
MESLPLALQREICSFAAAPELIPHDIDTIDNGDYDSSFATKLTEPSTHNLQRLAFVCRAWREFIEEMCTEHEATRVLTLHFYANKDSFSKEHIMEQLSASNNGATLLDLRIVVTTKKNGLWWDLDTLAPTFTGERETDSGGLYWEEWSFLLRQCPNLRRLDLSGMPLYGLAMGDLLDAASIYCSHLEALILPKQRPLHPAVALDNLDFVFHRLYLALERWNMASGGKGLRQLTVPSRSEENREGTSNEFLTAIFTMCPRLEYLDGWKRSYKEETRLVVSDISLCVSRAVWKMFCTSCAALREFSWVIVPFSDEFFLPFGQTGKPHLTRLQLTYNTRAPFRIRRNEYSTGALIVVVAGCPALEHLDVVLHRLQPCDTLIYPQIDEMIDPDVFNDDFILALIENCSKLRSLRIRELGSLSKSRKGMIAAARTITDRGLAALWRAPCLTCIDIQEVRCSARTILDVLSTNIDTFQPFTTRQVILRELGVCFGEVVQHVLESLVKERHQEGTGTLSRTPLVISLSCRRGYVFERSWLVKMQQAFQTKYPKGDLRFALFSLKKDNDTALHSGMNGSVEQAVIAKILARAWVKGDVLRIGRLVLYTDLSALDNHLRQVLQRRANRNTSWIVNE